MIRLSVAKKRWGDISLAFKVAEKSETSLFQYTCTGTRNALYIPIQLEGTGLMVWKLSLILARRSGTIAQWHP